MTAKSTEPTPAANERIRPASGSVTPEYSKLVRFVAEHGFPDFDEFWKLVEDLPKPAISAEQERARAVLKEFSDARTRTLEGAIAAWSIGLLGPKPPPLTQEQKLRLLARAAKWLRDTRPDEAT
ncbi:hypothetical protein G8A07_06970 [Roseateles sp. DAIF2]|uniref:hypothetical protein n=1 Tax=Roseateles sp. DAIF2 TaxID=2714952 RepID=UPI0018A24DD0|nr:hypothetical protein [Roseateles sp. DAIF2]QPF72695.1 hypothetical protein G8A07_06970 [Roseateles sp. DAIF2]